MHTLGTILASATRFFVITAVADARVRLAPLAQHAEDLAVPVPSDELVWTDVVLAAGVLYVLVAEEGWQDPAGLRPVGAVALSVLERVLRRKATALAQEHYALAHAPKTQAAFDPDRSAVPVAGRVYGSEEIDAVLQAGLDFWLTSGRFNHAFERGLSEFLDLKYVLTVNSGSSANLLAVSALMSHLLGERALRPGDEVVTVAAGFPTTVNPILQNGLIPVFVDVDLETLNVIAERIETAITERTKAVILAHTLGNPFNLATVMAICRRHGLWLVEDCCDALGSEYVLPAGQAALSRVERPLRCGTFGHIATYSFYPAHHITMGEGGAVATADPLLRKILESMRDWGRDCWCPPGHDNTCRRRFGWKLGELPEGYDHKYIYSHAGYNLKISDMQAAVGAAQLRRLPEFVERRRENYALWTEALAGLEGDCLLTRPTAGGRPSWFGLPVTLVSTVPGLREELMRYLNDRRIATRLLFGGNLIRQPYFTHHPYRVAGSLENTDSVMLRTFWLGVYPALDKEHIQHAAQALRDFFGRR